MSDHLVSLPDIVRLQSHPRQSASLHEVDQHVPDGLEVVPPALFYPLEVGVRGVRGEVRDNITEINLSPGGREWTCSEQFLQHST